MTAQAGPAGREDPLDFDMDGDVLEDITNMESTFYTQGYSSGYAHGALHGLFEGRQLGKEKAWELWEEVGYYEGWAEMWIGVLGGKVADGEAGTGAKVSKRGKEARALNHAQTLLELVSSFPRHNPSEALAPGVSAVEDPADPTEGLSGSIAAPAPAAPLDLATLISSIRARYRLLCSSLGTRPRMQNATIIEAVPGSGAAAATGLPDQDAAPSEGVVQGIEGPMKGVDTRQLRF
ncbi:hypothetical protein IAU60_006157 [Kwoniella sp. DSM 27419]